METKEVTVGLLFEIGGEEKEVVVSAGLTAPQFISGPVEMISIENLEAADLAGNVVELSPLQRAAVEQEIFKRYVK